MHVGNVNMRVGKVDMHVVMLICMWVKLICMRMFKVHTNQQQVYHGCGRRQLLHGHSSVVLQL